MISRTEELRVKRTMSGTPIIIITTVRQVKLALMIAVSNLLLCAYYLFVGFRLSRLFTQFDAETPNPIFNKYFLGFLILTLLSFAYWNFLKRRVKKGLEINLKNYNLILLFLSAPIIYLIATQIHSLVKVYVIVPLTF